MGIWASLFSSPSVIKKAADGIYATWVMAILDESPE